MQKEIDLHSMNYEDALKIFIQKYNEFLSQGYCGEICIIHGYGANRLEANPVIMGKLRSYLSKQQGKLLYRLDLNPGVTYVKPIERLIWKGKKKR